MSYTLPAFNLVVNIWHNGTPISNPPDLITVGNLAYGRRVTTQYWDWADSGISSVFAPLLLPPLVDVRDPMTGPGRDTIEVPAGSGRFYEVDYVDDVGKGFPNEHRFALMRKLIPWPVPIP